MKTLRGLLSRFPVVGELMVFLWQRKLWWLIPVVVMLVILGLLVVLGSTGVAPFIYTLF